ncbi:alpha/beta hydrolase [uncultured Amnibacterium sp.]|uniref:alpha/beta hydrolase n=1 Tax=uncultured Amnibacterium sp. TaxID=1631851 RepID=UPI0035C9D122
MTTGTARPRFDPELRASLAIVGGMFPPTITPDLIGFMRTTYASGRLEDDFEEAGITRTDHECAGHGGGGIRLSLLRPRGDDRDLPVLLYIHSGGLMFGDRFSGIETAIEWIRTIGVAVLTVEYRLAPEHPDPYAREDVYAALRWIALHAGRNRLRRDRVLVMGASAGGGLAAGLALAARDRGGPAIIGQVLDYPMLDDRGATGSTAQFDGVGVWDRVSNETGWTASLGAGRGGPDVSPYAAPSRAADLSALPPAFIDVGAAEIFRDEAIDYAERIWAAGGDAELHVWSGGFHAFDIFAPHTRLARGMIQARSDWVGAVLAD